MLKMRKLIFLLIVIFAGVELFAQQEKHDTLFYTCVGKDTTVFRIFRRDVPYVELDVTTMADNDTVSVGFSADKSVIIPVSNLFPMKLTKANYKSNVNGTIKYRIGIIGDFWNSKYIAVRIKFAGTSGTVKPSLIFNP